MCATFANTTVGDITRGVLGPTNLTRGLEVTTEGLGGTVGVCGTGLEATCKGGGACAQVHTGRASHFTLVALAVTASQLDTDATTKVDTGKVLLTELRGIVLVGGLNATSDAVVEVTAGNTNAVAAALLESLAGFAGRTLRAADSTLGEAVTAVLGGAHTSFGSATLSSSCATTRIVFAHSLHSHTLATGAGEVGVAVTDTDGIGGRGSATSFAFFEELELGAGLGVYAAVQGWLLATLAESLSGRTSVVTSFAFGGLLGADGDGGRCLDAGGTILTNRSVVGAVQEAVELTPDLVSDALEASVAWVLLVALFTQLLTAGGRSTHTRGRVAGLATGAVRIADALVALRYTLSVFALFGRCAVCVLGTHRVVVVGVVGVTLGVVGVTLGVVGVALGVVVVVVTFFDASFFAGSAVGLTDVTFTFFGLAIVVAGALVTTTATSDVEAAD